MLVLCHAMLCKSRPKLYQCIMILAGQLMQACMHAGTLTSAATHPLHPPRSPATAAIAPPALTAPATAPITIPETPEGTAITWIAGCPMATCHPTIGIGTQGMDPEIIQGYSMEGPARGTMQMPIRQGGSWNSCLLPPQARRR